MKINQKCTLGCRIDDSYCDFTQLWTLSDGQITEQAEIAHCQIIESPLLQKPLIQIILDSLG